MRFAWAGGLQTRLYLLVLLTVIPAFGAIVYHAVQDRRSGAVQASQELGRLAQAVAFDYRLLVEGERQFLSALSYLPQLRGDAAACSRFMASLLQKSGRYLNIGVIDRDGNLRCSAVPFRAPVYAGNSSYFQDAIKGEGFSVDDFQVRQLTGKPSVNFGMPLLDATGAPAAVVFSAVSLSWLSESVSHTRLPDGASTMVIDRDGKVLIDRSDAGSGQRLTDKTVLSAVRLQIEGGAVRGTGANGVFYLYGFAPLRNESGRTTAHVLVDMPLALAYAEADRRFVINLAVLATVALIMWLVARGMAGRLILRPVNALTEATGRFGGGELSARTGMPHEDTEFGRLARGFDDMAQRVEQQVVDQRRDEERIRRLNRVYAFLSRVNHTIVHRRERAALFDDFCRIAVEEGGFRFVWVGWVDEGLRAVRPIAHHGYDESFLDNLVVSLNATTAAGASPAAYAVREERVSVCNDIDTDRQLLPWRDACQARGYRAWGAFPLRVEGRVVAVINMLAHEPGGFDAEEQHLLTQVASDLSFALDTIEQETQRREAEKRLKFLAYHDPITELPNLLYYDELLKGLVERARTENAPFAMMIVTIERLGEVTATFGHHLESELLRLMAQRLRQSVRVEDIIARGAGENFNVVLPNADAEGATQTARHLLKVMEQPFAIEGMDIELGVAIGIALFPGHSEELDVLDRCAHAALTEARKAGGGYAFYSAGQDLFSPARLALVSELRHAIDDDQLMLVYQPKVDLISGEVAGVEALVRWRHPTRGLISPEDFIPVAEQTGLIRALSYWVMDAAAKQGYNFRRAGYSIPVAVNLSTLNLLDPRLPTRLQNQCLTWGIEPGAIELEITESAIMQDPAGAYQVLRRLNEMGYLLYIDDFGTGYSSLGYLKKLPVDALKIDKSFVLDMLKDKDAEQIVRSTIDLAHDLGLKVVAEGVEQQEVLDKLGLLGCDMAQGFYIGKPMEADRLLEWLAASSWRARHVAIQETQRRG